jgi:DNA-directed RNA polymerase specialized sigma24 family protein
VSLEEVVGEEPTEEFASRLWEDLNHLLETLDDDLLRKLTRLKLEEYTNQEIKDKLEISLSSVERKLRMIRKQLSEQEGD